MIPGIAIVGASKAPKLTLIDRTTGTNIGSMTYQDEFGGGLAAAFNGDTNQPEVACAVHVGTNGLAYVGKTLTGPKRFGQAITHGSNDDGYLNSAPTSVVLNIRGKNGAAPSSSTDGTIIGTISFTDMTNESGGRTIVSTDLVTAWDHIFLQITGHTTVFCGELILYEWA